MIYEKDGQNSDIVKLGTGAGSHRLGLGFSYSDSGIDLLDNVQRRW